MKTVSLLCLLLLFFGCSSGKERKPDYVSLNSYNIAGGDNFIYVVTKEYVFTSEGDARTFLELSSDLELSSGVENEQ